MKTTVLQKDLNKILSISSRFVSPHAALPVLSNFKIHTKGAKLIIEATNLEMSISGSIGAQTTEEGEVAIPARVLTDVVSNLSGEKIELSLDGENLTVESEGFSAQVLGLNASEFPEVPSAADKAVEIPKEELLNAVSKVIFASSGDDTRPALAGVLFYFESENLSLVSSDGFRLSRKIVKHKSPASFKLIIPKNILLELVKIGKDAKKLSLHVNQDDKQIIFLVDDIVLSSRLVEGEYPPYEKIIPESGSTVVNVSKVDLQKAVRLASVFSRDGANIVTLEIKEGSVRVLGESAKSGSQVSLVAAKLIGPELSILYNYRYLEEFLGVVSGESVEMRFNSPTAAGVFLDSSDGFYLHLIMPVKS